MDTIFDKLLSMHETKTEALRPLRSFIVQALGTRRTRASATASALLSGGVSDAHTGSSAGVGRVFVRRPLLLTNPRTHQMIASSLHEDAPPADKRQMLLSLAEYLNADEKKINALAAAAASRKTKKTVSIVGLNENAAEIGFVSAALVVVLSVPHGERVVSADASSVTVCLSGGVERVAQSYRSTRNRFWLAWWTPTSVFVWRLSVSPL